MLITGITFAVFTQSIHSISKNEFMKSKIIFCNYTPISFNEHSKRNTALVSSIKHKMFLVKVRRGKL